MSTRGPSTVAVLQPGLQTTLQDRGRNGWRHLGVGRAGALDDWSHTLANLLVGNATDDATLEITLTGPALHFDRTVTIALCGAPLDADVDGHALPMMRPLRLPAGCTLRLGACQDGARSYLAIAGGFAAIPVLGSTATDLRGGFGGVHGRALHSGDVLQLRQPAAISPFFGHNDHTPQTPLITGWWLHGAHDERPPQLVRVLPGRDTTVPGDAVCAQRWSVSASSNRQGLRLQGEPITAANRQQRISEPVLPGTVQLPADGQPIVLLADAQTHGGYPCIGHVIRADWPKLAQLRPGASLWFEPCTHDEARAAWRRRCERLARLALALQTAKVDRGSTAPPFAAGNRSA